jgi:hypothetical protein
MKLIFIFLVTLSLSAVAAELKYDNYLKLQEALAADDLASALAAHKLVCERDLKAQKTDYAGCGKSFKGIDELRESFKKLSAIYIARGDKKARAGLMEATCPMASANWIQKEGGLRNPYYGKSMLDCGEKVKK